MKTIDEECQELKHKKFKQRYGWVTEYNRDVAEGWLDDYWDFCTTAEVSEDLEATVKFIDDARKLIFWLLDEANRNKAERFKGMPVYTVKVPHTKDWYYFKFEDSLDVTDNINRWLKPDAKIEDINEILFTKDEIKYYGLEDCVKSQVHL